MGRKHLRLTVIAGVVGFMAVPAGAQQPAEPAGQGALPEVEVIQKKAAPAAKKKAASAPVQASPAPLAAPQSDVADGVPAPGERGADGRVVGNAPDLSPINPTTGMLPTDLQDFAGAATRVTAEDLEQLRPLTNHDALASVPGIVTTTDDGLGRHSGIGIRGSNFRRSRKVLMMEDGQSINFSTYLDASVHYTPPTDRIENIEVIRGTVVAYGPLNNHGVINFQNLNPFGKSETVVKGVISYTDDINRDVGNYRHTHTRQNLGNVGLVASYSGAEAGGAWDNEVLSYNDFYGSLGWRGVDQDLTISGVYFRERDAYDEDNFVGSISDFFANGRSKSGNDAFADGASNANSYNSDYYRLQLAHNWYVTDDTTISTRIYGHDQERNRAAAREAFGDDFYMRGRNRHYQYYGAESRVEFANQPLAGSIKQDIQVGARYEYHKLRNCTAFGLVGQVLDDDNAGNCYAEDPPFPEEGALDTYRADSFAAFIQSAVHLTPNLTVTPGVRFETYDVTFESEFPDRSGYATSEHDHVLPGIGFAWVALRNTTLYGGYHRGFAPHIVREVTTDTFPLGEEVGDNFQIGVRSTALRGVTFDVAYFHSIIDEYQLKESFSNDRGDGIYGQLDEVEINGVELAMRVDSRPFTGGPWNVFGQSTYTYTDGKINRGSDAIFEDLPETDVSGNRLPFAIEHFANLTVGVAYKQLWDASMTWTYRGDFFTNAQNSVPLTCIDDLGAVDFGCDDDPDELVGGKVDEIWLLSARGNLNVSEQLSLFVAGTNLTDEFYVAELSDGAKPGLGRTIFGGFTWKFD